MAELKRNQLVKNQLDELKSLGTNDNTSILFILDEVIDFADSKEHSIVGRILPTSDIFKQGAFQIEMKLPSAYPLDPPKVRFITPIYHPNVGKDGEFRHEFLQKTARWVNTASLIDVVKTVLERIDNPDVDYSINKEVAEEYTKNRNEFNRKALEIVTNHSLARN